MKNIINNIILFFALLFLAIALFKPVPAHAGTTIPSTGSSTLDAINKFVNDTLNWKQGDPVPDTGSSTLNAIGQGIIHALNYTPTGSGAGGAGGSWGDGSGNFSGSGAGGSFTPNKTYDYCTDGMGAYPTPESACQARAKRYGFSKYALRGYMCDVLNNNGSVWDGNTPISCYNEKKKCPENSVLKDGVCVYPEKDCFAPNTYYNGSCVPPKQPDPVTKYCPYGYTLTNGQCVKDPPKTCDPAVQQCNPDGTPKCDCCEKLDAINSNISNLVNQNNDLGQSLSKMIAQQQTNNLKIDLLNSTLNDIKNQSKLSNNNLQLLQNQIGELNKLIGQGVKIDIAPIVQKLDEIKNDVNKNHLERTTNDNKNHADLTALIAKSLIDSETQKPFLKLLYEEMKNQPQKTAQALTPVIDSATSQITEKQDEQTGILKEIRDLFKEDKENPTPPPEVTPEEQESSLKNPLDGLKNYDISQNRFGVSQVQCPPDRQFVALGATFTIGMSQYCGQMQILGYVFLMMAYIAGGIIVVKGAGGN